MGKLGRGYVIFVSRSKKERKDMTYKPNPVTDGFNMHHAQNNFGKEIEALSSNAGDHLLN